MTYRISLIISLWIYSTKYDMRKFEPMIHASCSMLFASHSADRFGLDCIVQWYLVWVRTFSVMYDHTFSKLANHQIRHQATHKVGCLPGDCIWSLQSSSGGLSGYVWVNILTLSPPEGHTAVIVSKTSEQHCIYQSVEAIDKTCRQLLAYRIVLMLIYGDGACSLPDACISQLVLSNLRYIFYKWHAIEFHCKYERFQMALHPPWVLRRQILLADN